MAQWGPANKRITESPAQIPTHPFIEHINESTYRGCRRSDLFSTYVGFRVAREIVGYISPSLNSAESSNGRQPYAPHHQPGPKEPRMYIYALTHAHLRIN